MVTVCRLLSGIEIVGTIVKSTVKSITINNPLQIMYVRRIDGPPAVTLQRYIPFSSQEDLTISRSHVEVICEPIQGLHQYYINALKSIQEHVDPSLVTDLMDANEPRKFEHDSYIAMLEQLMSKKPLN